MFSHRHVPYLSHVAALATKLSDWKGQRLPPPRVNQSTVGLSCSLELPLKSERNSMTRSDYLVSDSCNVLSIDCLSFFSVAVAMGLVLQPPSNPDVPIHPSSPVCTVLDCI